MENKQETKVPTEPVLAGTVFKIEELHIWMHAIEAFCSRTRSDFPTAPDEIRSRLKDATLSAHFTKGRASWHFQDSQDLNIYYVVRQEKRKGGQHGFCLVTVRDANEFKVKSRR